MVNICLFIFCIPFVATLANLLRIMKKMLQVFGVDIYLDLLFALSRKVAIFDNWPTVLRQRIKL